jgi:predicted MFS family arabinose efflux permease
VSAYSKPVCIVRTIVAVAAKAKNRPMPTPDFPRVLAAEGVSNFGSMLSRLALPWLATLVLQASAWQMAALLVAQVVAAALGGLWLAGEVDRRPKRSAMLASDVLRALLFGALAWAAWRGQATMALLVAVAALDGLAGATFALARSAWIAQRVPHDELPRRNAQLSAVGSLSETAAFALGGWLFQGLGAALALAADAASFVLSALCLRGVHPAPAPAVAPAARGEGALRRLWAEAAGGLALVAAHPGLRVLAAIEWLLAAGGALFGTCFMIFVTRDAGYAPGPLGLVFAVGGLGALLGAWAAPALGRRLGAGGAMACGLALMTAGNAAVPLAAAGGAVGLALLVLHQLVGDGGQVLHDIHDRTLRQTLADASHRARADAGIRFAGQVATLAGALGGGAVGDALGARSALLLAVVLFGCAAVLAWAARARFHRA